MGAPNFIPGGLLEGWRLGQQDYNTQQRLDQEKQMNEQRIADMRTQNAIAQHNLGRMDTLDQQHDQAFGLEQSLGQQRQQIGQHTLDRLPTTDQQADQEFGLRTKLQQGQIDQQPLHAALLRSQIGSQGQEQALRNLQIQQQRLGLSDSMLAHATQQNQRTLVGAYQDWAQSGDPSKFVDAYNSTIGHTLGHNITSLKQNDDGTYTAEQEGGKPLQFKTPQEALQGAMSMNDPQLMVASLYGQQKAAQEAAEARAKDPKKFGELIRGEDGSLGNYDLGTNKFTPLTDQDGKPLRGTVAGKARTGVANDAAEAYYAEQVKNGSSHQQALNATQQYMKTFHPGVQGSWQAGAQPAPQNGVAAAVAGSSPKSQNATPVQSTIPPAAVQMLRQNPNLRAQFDQKYGQGSSNQYLNQ